MMKRLFGPLLAILLLFAAAGCSNEEGPAEKLGRKIDDVVKTATDEGKNALDKFGDDAGKAFDDVKATVNEMAGEIGKGLEEAKETLTDREE